MEPIAREKLDAKISGDNVILKTPNGRMEVTFKNTPYALTLPDHNIYVEGPSDVVERIANDVIGGTATLDLIKALGEISKLDKEYHPPLLKKIGGDPVPVADEAIKLQAFENMGYKYFSTGNQLLVRPSSDPCNKSPFVVSFVDARKAECFGTGGRADLAKRFASWISKGSVAVNYKWSPYVLADQADLVEKGISELHLPYDKVGKTIRLISSFTAKHKQGELFDVLKGTGFSNRELQQLERKVREREIAMAREKKYEEAGNFGDFVWLNDTEELLFPERFLIRLSDPPTLYRVEAEYEHEMGRYIVRKRWGKNTQLEPVRRLFPYSLSGIIKNGKKALGRIAEPYRSRLSTFLVSLSLSR